ncbi:hypothetical protein PVAP13_3NG304618 [Panicum virgatum]|uniref:Uncharacterized protein n=1 Tax=Panicum virgatum TaxID=38727 RepID=A0A8T0UCL4_PANVG|nr:hypothetical protein PVAP13_3NG304618 [Panicum virgatum]
MRVDYFFISRLWRGFSFYCSPLSLSPSSPSITPPPPPPSSRRRPLLSRRLLPLRRAGARPSLPSSPLSPCRRAAPALPSCPGREPSRPLRRQGRGVAASARAARGSGTRAGPAAAARAQGQRRRHARPGPWRRRRRAQPPPPSSLAARSRPLLLPPSRRFLPAALGLGGSGRVGARLRPRRTRGDLLDPELRRRPDPPLSVRFSPPLSLCRSSPARRRSAPCSQAAAARCSARARTLAVASSGLHGHRLIRPPRRGSARPPPSSSLAQWSRAPRRPRAAPFLLRRPRSARLSSACSRSAAAELRRQACPPRGHGGRHSPSLLPPSRSGGEARRPYRRRHSSPSAPLARARAGRSQWRRGEARRGRRAASSRS